MLTAYLLANCLPVNAQNLDDTTTDPPLPPEGYQFVNFPESHSPTETLLIANELNLGEIWGYPMGGNLGVFFSPVDNPEGIDIDPVTGDVIAMTYPNQGGRLTRVWADAMGAEVFTAPLGMDNDIVVNNQGYIFAARNSSKDVIRIAPDGASWQVVVNDAGPVEDLAFDPATGDVYWGSVGPDYRIGKIPGGVGCPCPVIYPPIPVTAMAFDEDDDLPDYNLVISRFYSDWVYLVNFETGKFQPVVKNPWVAPEDLAIQNGKIIFPDMWAGRVLEIDPVTKTITTLIPAGTIQKPAGVTLGEVVMPNTSPTPAPGKLLDVPLFRQYSLPWGPQEYDHGLSQGLWCGSTMSKCGCAVTSLAIILKYHGVTKDPYGNPTTPETVNDFFREGVKCDAKGCTSMGYAFGDIRWSAANQYSKVASSSYGSPKVIYTGGGSRKGHDPNLYKDEIENNRPVILSMQNHFVVATGYVNDTFTIHDPYFDDRTQLDHPAYNNTSSGYHLFKTTNTDYSNLEIVSLTPAQILIIDPDGKQTGFDFTNQSIKEEIPYSTYHFDPALAEPEGSNPPPPIDAGVYWGIVFNPQPGKYQITISTPDQEPGNYAIYASDKQANLVYDLFKTQALDQPVTQTIYYQSESGGNPMALQVAIDIKPGSGPNSINCRNKNEIIPVAILSTATFDATTIDHTTVTFEGAKEFHTDKKTGALKRHEEDVDGDGDTDLVLHFRLRDTKLECLSKEARLEGESYNGLSIIGTNFVRIIK